MTATTADAEAVATSSVHRGRTGRRTFMVAITAFLLLGVLDLFGVRTRTAADGNASLTYASVSRRGLPAPWRLRITVPSGTSSVLVRMRSDYLGALDVRGVQPKPASERATSDIVEWQFDRPPPTLAVSLEANVGPHAIPGRRSATTSVFMDGRRTALLSYRTWMLP